MNTDEVGIYKIIIEAEDKNKNKSVAEYEVEVIENLTIVKKGQTFIKEWEDKEVEVTILDYGYREEVFSESNNMFASYLPDKADEKYYVVEFLIKNNSGDTISYRDFEPDIMNDKTENEYILRDKYKYKFQWIDTTSSAMSSFFSIKPLNQLKVYSVASIPDELTDVNPTVFFTINEDQYVIE